MQPNNIIMNNNSTSNNNGGNAYVIREQDQFMPIANVIRIMRRILPTHAKISDDAKETIQECVSEYISFVTGEANERCQREQRKTVTAEDVLWAMGKLGFDNYVEPLSVYLNRYREAESERSRPGEPPFLKRNVDFGPSFYGPGYYQSMYDAAGGYYRDGSGGAGGSGSSSSQNGLGGYDPFGHDHEFK